MAPTYLLKKHQRWWYDRGIPKHLRTPLGKTRFRVNLNTSDQKAALTLKPKAEALYNLAIDKAQRQLNGTLAPLEQLEDFSKAFRDAYSSPDEDGDFVLDASPDEIDKAESQIETHLRDYFADLVTGRAPKGLRAFIDEYLASASVRQLDPRTLLERKTALNRLLAWCSSNGVLNVLKFTRAHARAFTNSLKGEPPTIIKALQAPTALWRFMQEEGVAVDPTIWKNLAPKKPLREKNEDRQRSFSSAELKTLLCGPASALLKDAMLVALYSGMRLSELGELRVDHIDVARQTILVPGTKTASALRMIPLHPKLSELLKPRMAGKSPRAYVFHELGEDEYPED